AVVSITGKQLVRQADPFFWDFDDWFSFRPKLRELPFLGSGFLIDPRGYIITNAHVVQEAVQISVVMADQQAYEAKRIVASRAADLALVKIEPKQAGQTFPTVRLWTGEELLIGETVLAIGNPFGYQHTLTDGIISARHRELEIEDRVFENLIQISAPINPGNSGGPLLNINGDLIGVNMAIRRAAQGIGFALPVQQLRRDLPEMIHRTIETDLRVDLGVLVSEEPVASEPATAGGIPAGRVRVATVRPGSAAAQAGLKSGDHIVAVNGRVIPSAIQFYLEILELPLDSRVRLDIAGGAAPPERPSGAGDTIEMVLRQRPRPDAQKLALALLGVRFEELTERTAGRYSGLAPSGSVIITQIERDSPAAYAGIERGDILVGVNDTTISDREDLGFLLEGIEPGAIVKLSLYRARQIAWGIELTQFERTVRTSSQSTGDDVHL
ncbi:MAG: trypsin-like peptidase domain-containing protein, partial [Sedimentisphaerales bacterium]|nr:trypsin-like peptidase domain-containing protein [Sedimentisphaerales bacterium]